MSFSGDNYLVPGANPFSPPVQGGTVNNVTGSGSATVSQPVAGTFNVDVPAIPTQNSVNEMFGNVTIESADGSIVVENDFPNQRINLKPFFNVISGSFATPTYSWSGPPGNDLTMSAISATTYTGVWMFFFQATIGSSGWTPTTSTYTRWTAGPQFSQNVRHTDIGNLPFGTTLEFSNSFIDEFTVARPVVVGCTLNNITFTSNPSFGGIFYACKLSDM